MYQKKSKGFIKNNKLLLVVWSKSAFREPLKVYLRKAGFNVSEFDYRKSTVFEKFIFAASLIFPALWHFGNYLINKRLIQKVKILRPSVVFVSKGETVTESSVKQLNSKGVITINWYTDLFKKNYFFKKTLATYNYVFTADNYDAKKNKQKMNIYHLPYAGTPINDNPTFKKRKFDLVFIGSWTKERENFIKILTDFNPAIWGDRKWAQSSVKRFYMGKWLTPNEILKVFQHTKIALNEHQFKTNTKTTLNLRVFEATANGAMVLTDFRKDLPLLFKTNGPKKEVVLYKNLNQAAKLIHYYLKNDEERIKIAKRGFIRTARDHTYEDRIDKIMNIIQSYTRDRNNKSVKIQGKNE